MIARRATVVASEKLTDDLIAITWRHSASRA
jgi:hypothetical protein